MIGKTPPEQQMSNFEVALDEQVCLAYFCLHAADASQTPQEYVT